MNFVNLTQHSIVVRLTSGQERRFAPSGQVTRCTTTEVEDGLVDGIPVVTRAFGRVDGLPEPQAGTAYLVSRGLVGRGPSGRARTQRRLRS
ncbi:MAG: hypothetical protein HY814_11050 [Candidatus Riflebacteria bacterium]|nr:hypothetical protein [Candidatus Riflebacteria bacterium]